jgi:hypothetical protein
MRLRRASAISSSRVARAASRLSDDTVAMPSVVSYFDAFAPAPEWDDLVRWGVDDSTSWTADGRCQRDIPRLTLTDVPQLRP